MTKLAYVGMIQNIYPIPNADRIESAEVVCGVGGKWRGTVVKNQFQIGDLCEVYLQDAVLPDIERFSFLKERRIRMQRLRGMPSECLIMELQDDLPVGTEISELKNVTKYEKTMLGSIGGDIIRPFPSHIPKTDEPNFQTAQHMIEALRGLLFYATIKADGASGTIYWDDGIHGCSRNYELRDTPTAAVWQLARKYNLEYLLRVYPDLALQFEIVGPGIQKNPMGLKELEMRLFNLYNWERREYLSFNQFVSIAEEFRIPTVQIISYGDIFDFSDDEELRLYAQRKYPNGAHAEGIVIRPMVEQQVNGERLSFKVINLLYRD